MQSFWSFNVLQLRWQSCLFTSFISIFFIVIRLGIEQFVGFFELIIVFQLLLKNSDQ
uniref:Uncharacterized protein n=1 Tax=Tetranychus urticae TaxID=32264 RepID=T1K5Y7_TETUR